MGGLICPCLVAWSSWFIFLLCTYDYLYFILFSFQIVSSFVRDSSYHDMYYKGCGLLCAHKKSFNTAIPVRSLGPYMCVLGCTKIWRFCQKITELSQKLGLTIRRKHANF